MRNVKRFLLLLLSALCVISLFGCSIGRKSDKLQIVVTNFPPYDFARTIAGDNADVTMLLVPGQESHSFEPTPKDMVTLQEADLIIYGGGVSDQWMETLLTSSEIDKSKTLSMMECTVGENAFTHDHESHDHSDNYAYDEHVWTSPAYAIAICEGILAKLCEIDSEHAETYRLNAENYKNELTALDNAFMEVTKHTNKPLIFGDRFPFRHFADRYQLSYFAAFPGCSDNTEPDAATVKDLIDKVNTQNIGYVFYTELSNHKVADAICEATGATPKMLHSCHTVTKEEFDRGETYLSLMYRNLDVLKEALL